MISTALPGEQATGRPCRTARPRCRRPRTPAGAGALRPSLGVSRMMRFSRAAGRACRRWCWYWQDVAHASAASCRCRWPSSRRACSAAARPRAFIERRHLVGPRPCRRCTAATCALIACQQRLRIAEVAVQVDLGEQQRQVLEVLPDDRRLAARVALLVQSPACGGRCSGRTPAASPRCTGQLVRLNSWSSAHGGSGGRCSRPCLPAVLVELEALLEGFQQCTRRHRPARTSRRYCPAEQAEQPLVQHQRWVNSIGTRPGRVSRAGSGGCGGRAAAGVRAPSQALRCRTSAAGSPLRSGGPSRIVGRLRFSRLLSPLT